jgi:hypothetical protein
MTSIVVNNRVRVQYCDWGCVSYFSDGTEFGAHAQHDHHYYVISHRSGYGDDVDRYAREHEVVHHLAGELFFGGVSPVLWALAHGEDVTPEAAAIEEAIVMLIQRWIRANERPIIGGIDWDALKARAIELMGS